MAGTDRETLTREEVQQDPGAKEIEEEQGVLELPNREAMTVIGFPITPPLEPPAIAPVDPSTTPE